MTIPTTADDWRNWFHRIRLFPMLNRVGPAPAGTPPPVPRDPEGPELYRARVLLAVSESVTRQLAEILAGAKDFRASAAGLVALDGDAKGLAYRMTFLAWLGTFPTDPGDRMGALVTIVQGSMTLVDWDRLVELVEGAG